MSRIRLGITLGDLNGIGPEVIIKALSDNRLLSLVTPVIYGSSRVLSFYKKMFDSQDFNYHQVKAKGQFSAKNINVVNCWEDVIEIVPGKPSKEAGKAALLAIRHACEEIREGHIDGLVTGPIDKHSIQAEDFPFKGHTDFLAHTFSVSNYMMCLVSEGLKVGLVTEHIPLSEVSKHITKELLESKLKTFDKFLKDAYGINKPRIAVLALNPHAGEEGVLGTEEQDVIKPVIQDMKNKGKIISGPFPADGFFGTLAFQKYDGVLAMYHDQGLIPLKLLAFDSAVNITAGLPIVRTSPDHGTAYSIAGKNLANPDSMRHAIYAAIDMLKYKMEPSKENIS